MSLGMILVGIGATMFGFAIRLLDSRTKTAILLQMTSGNVLIMAGAIDIWNGLPRGIVPLVFGHFALLLPFIWKKGAYAKPEAQALLMGLRKDLVAFLTDGSLGFPIFYAAYWILLGSFVTASLKLLILGLLIGVLGIVLIRRYDKLQNQKAVHMLRHL